ncbi:MAG: hypothetical protein ACXAEX_21005 [Promethearchaeota archaeon]
MPIIEGWEVSPDRHEKFEKMLSTDPIGDPLLTTKCMLGSDHGFLVVSDNGLAWRIQITYGTTAPVFKTGKSKWIRWHDVANIIPISGQKMGTKTNKPGWVFLEVKRRKKGTLVTDKRGNPKTKKWRLIIRPNKNEEKSHFNQRLATFYDLLMELFNKFRIDENLPISDSRI